jgi:glycosyltransferase involved in cell wall biosynthesis
MSPTVSIVTAVLNRRDTVLDALASVRAQTYPAIEHILIDGASTDGTTELLRARLDSRTHLVSEPDTGIYDALNKGLGLATGEILGLMHSDDTFASPRAVARIAQAFADPGIDAVYADLDYVSNADPSRIVRHWVSGPYDPNRLARGWMPPHPTLYLRRAVIDRLGRYDTSYRIAADYDAILRWFSAGIRCAYVPEVLVRMRTGGESNRSLGRILLKSREDYRALRRNGVGGLPALVLKNTSKLGQFLRRPATAATAAAPSTATP